MMCRRTPDGLSWVPDVGTTEAHGCGRSPGKKNGKPGSTINCPGFSPPHRISFFPLAVEEQTPQIKNA